MIKLPEHCIQKLLNEPEYSMGLHIVDIKLIGANYWVDCRGVTNCEYIINTQGFVTDDIEDIRIRIRK